MVLPDLTALRAKIDELDQEIQVRITQRAEIAIQVAQAKQALEENPEFYRPEREAEVLRMVAQRNHSVLPDEALQQIFQEIMSACLALQHPLHIAFLGPEGTYTHAAALKHFGHGAQLKAMQTIDEVFREITVGDVHCGIVPIENSTEGGVNQSLDLLVHSNLKIAAEIELSIHHYLLSAQPQLSAIQKIYSHPQSLAQCRMWLDRHLPGLPRISVNSNAQAAQLAAQEPFAAAIAGAVAGDIYALRVLAKRIEDYAENTTRFAVLSKQSPPPSGRDKTSLLLSMPNCPGALFQMLSPFSVQGLNLTRIESRPSHEGVWDYVFFIDLEGHIDQPKVSQALNQLAQQGVMVKHLGSYPVGRTVD